MGYGPEDAAIARKQEALNAAQFKDDNGFLKQVDAIVAGSLYGVCVMQVGWKRDEQERIMEQIDRMPLSGKVVRHIRKGKVVMFDGPESIMVDLLDFFPQPTVARLRDMKWVVRRYFLDLDDCRYLASIGTFDKAALSRLERDGALGGGQGALVTSIQRFQVRTGMDDETARFMDKYSRPIEILEFWGKVPSELSPDGVLSRVVTVANRRYMMRNRPNPYNHGQIPFLAYSPTPDLHYFYAPGKAEIVEKLQIVGNRYLNQSLDAADLMIDPMWFYDRGAGLVTRNLYSRPGRFVGLNGNPSNAIMPMQPYMQGLSVADQKISQIREFLQMGTGIVDDAVQGIGGDSRQTAREFIGRREAAGTRLMLESRIYEETMLEPMANMFAALSKQFLEPPVEVLILGDGSQIDPVTNMPIPASRETLSAYDLFPSYTADAAAESALVASGPWYSSRSVSDGTDQCSELLPWHLPHVRSPEHQRNLRCQPDAPADAPEPTTPADDDGAWRFGHSDFGTDFEWWSVGHVGDGWFSGHGRSGVVAHSSEPQPESSSSRRSRVRKEVAQWWVTSENTSIYASSIPFNLDRSSSFSTLPRIRRASSRTWRTSSGVSLLSGRIVHNSARTSIRMTSSQEASPSVKVY
jgi:hypothetical protein